MVYAQFYNKRVTPQSEALDGQVKNSAGGYAFPVDDWKRLDRFLILGSSEGSYYATAKELTRENAKAVERCLQADASRVVRRIVEISDSGRAAKNEPALFALALCTISPAKAEAFQAIPRVARTGTHLFHFAEYVQTVRGWGRGLRGAIANWYNTQDDLAYQVIKYRQRDGWTHRDLLRLSHPQSEANNAIYRWITQGEVIPGIIEGYDKATKAESEQEIVSLIGEYKLPWEAVDSKWLGSPKVWEALLPNLPSMATVRNLGRMTANGLLTPFSAAEEHVLSVLNGKLPRVHPMQILLAMKTYSRGSGIKGSLQWTPLSRIVDALDAAFYRAFDNVEPTNKRVLLALDVSGSMGAEMMNSPLTCREAAAAMAMVTARTEPRHHIMAFADTFMPLEVSPRERLDDVVNKITNLPFGGTDCALPMLWALGYGQKAEKTRGLFGYDRYSVSLLENQHPVVPVDAFVVLTDSETWSNPAIHPIQALQQYRRTSGIPAKMAVVAMTSAGFSIADPNDAGCIDIVGFDTAVPRVLSDFMTDTHSSGTA